MGSEMAERRDKIAQLVSDEGDISFSRIKQAFPNVSEMTLRTDLKALDAERRIVRVHGGARSVSQIVGTDDLFDSRQAKNVEAKSVIARKAAEMVPPNSTVFLDSGSTTTALARELGGFDCLVFTNSITCAAELSRFEKPTTILVGGRLNRYSLCMSGARALEDVRQLSFDIFFLGVTGYQEGAGITCGSDDDAALKRTCIERAGKTVALMDASKVDRRSTFKVCDLDDLDAVVADDALPASFLKVCEDVEVHVL